MNNNLAWGVVAVLIIGAVVVGFSSQGGWMRGQSGMANVDQHFIEQMIPHHEGAIAMAELALVTSKRPEILSLSNSIIEAQTKEINDMRAWYKDWFGSDVPADSSAMGMGGQDMHMQSMEGDLDALKAATDFDKEFLEQMIPHHEMAVMMGRMLDAGTTRPEMKQLADNIIASQTSEIELMRSWLKAW